MALATGPPVHCPDPPLAGTEIEFRRERGAETVSVIVCAAFRVYAAGSLSSMILSLGGRGAGMSRRIAASIATDAGSSIRSGSPCRVRERRASSAPACRMAARSSALIVAGGRWSSVVCPHPLPWSRSVVVHVHVHGACGSLRAQARARPWTDWRSLDVAVSPARAARTAGWPAGTGVPRRAAVPWPHGPPRSARGLYGAPGPGVLAQPVVDPTAAHAGRGHQVGDRCSVRAGSQ